jgi:hypothetical protein
VAPTGKQATNDAMKTKAGKKKLKIKTYFLMGTTCSGPPFREDSGGFYVSQLS